MNKNKFLVRVNLQTFADGEGEQETSIQDEGFGAYDPSTAYEGIEQVDATGTQTEPQVQDGEENPTNNQQQEQIQQPEQLQTQQQQEQQFLDFGGRKVPHSPELEGLHKDYVEQQRYIQQLTQQNQQFQQMMMQQMQQQQTQQPAQPQEELPPLGSEEWWNKFYEDPTLLIKQTEQQLYEKAKQEIMNEIKPLVEPLAEERKWNQEVQRVSNMFPDFQQITPQIQEVLNQRPELADMPNGLEYAYYQAKAQSAQAQPSPEQLLNDPRFQQQIMQNDTIRNQMISQYVNQKQQTNQQIPPVMGNQAGGHTSFTPQSSPKTLREASKLTMKQLGIS